MGHNSTMRRQKGCNLCKPHKYRDNGHARRKPFAELRKIGRRRRVSRHDLGDALEANPPRVSPSQGRDRGRPMTKCPNPNCGKTDGIHTERIPLHSEETGVFYQTDFECRHCGRRWNDRNNPAR